MSAHAPSSRRSSGHALAKLGQLRLEALDATGQAVRLGGRVSATGAGQPARRAPVRLVARRLRAAAHNAPRADRAGGRAAAPARAASAGRASRAPPPPSRTGAAARCGCAARPGSAGPRSISTQASASSPSSRPRARSSVCRYFIVRRLAQLASVAHLRCHQAVECRPDGAVVVVHDRVAVRGLVAGQAQRVERERIDVGRGALLLDQTADHTDLDGVRFHRLSRRTPACSCARAPVRAPPGWRS